MSGIMPQADKQEGAFTIQPHPATSNNPAAEEGGKGEGLMEQAKDAVLRGVGHHVPDAKTQENIEKPMDKDAYAARTAELNK